MGTTFRLDRFSHEPKAVWRIYAGAQFGDNSQHEVRALYAPLRIGVKSRQSYGIYFQGKNFPAGVDTEANYKFNSYRLTYRYTLSADKDWILKLGATGKIRDAEISLKQEEAGLASRKNIGFVPLLNIFVSYKLSSRWMLGLDVDALASTFGRAEDLYFFGAYNFTERSMAKIGYRTVEGGSDGGGGVYNFAWINYLVTSVEIHF